TYIPLSGSVTAHGAVGQDKAGSSVFRKLAQHMQDPGIVGISCRWRSKTRPAWIILQFIFLPPLTLIEGRIGHDIIGLEVRMLVFKKSIGRYISQISRNAT